ncbi:MAG: hypothetical protein ACO1SV_09970 [Fimbriimonas sp.]
MKPRRPTGLYVALGAGTLFAMGLIAYMSYALPKANEPQYETTAVIVDDRADGRAQRFTPRDNSAPAPSTVIINPPPIVQTAPPVVVKPPERPIIVEGDTSPAPDAVPVKPKTDTTLPDDSTSNDTTDTDSGDVDGKIVGDR